MSLDDFGDFPTVHDGGEYRSLALLPRRFPTGVCAQVWGTSDAAPYIERSKWEPFDLRDFVTWTPLDQDGLNYCHSFAATQAHMLARNLAGLPFVELSAGCLGSQVTGQRNAGASLDDVLPVLQDAGQTTAAMVGQLAYRQREWPADWQTAAAQYALPEAWDCGHEKPFDAIASAILLGCPVAFGMDWGRGGHALCAMGLFRDGGEWGLSGIGSWGPKAHDGDGFWKFTERKLPGLAKYGAFAVRAVRRQGDLKPPTIHPAA